MLKFKVCENMEYIFQFKKKLNNFSFQFAFFVVYFDFTFDVYFGMLNPISLMREVSTRIAKK